MLKLKYANPFIFCLTALAGILCGRNIPWTHLGWILVPFPFLFACGMALPLLLNQKKDVLYSALFSIGLVGLFYSGFVVGLFSLAYRQG